MGRPEVASEMTPINVNVACVATQDGIDGAGDDGAVGWPPVHAPLNSTAASAIGRGSFAII